MISCKHPKRTYNNSNGEGEISTWGLVDNTDAINLVAFNLDSYILSNKLIEGKVKQYSNKIFFPLLFTVIRIHWFINSNYREYLQKITSSISINSK